MNTTDQLILPPDVMLLPATQLPARLRDQIEDAEGEYAIVRPGVRAYSKLVDAQFAELAAQFRTPKSILEAIIGYSLRKQLEPEQVLDNAFPLLQHLMYSNLLVPADSPEAGQIAPSFRAGDGIDDLTVRGTVQVLDDSEIYRVECSDGTAGALKIMRRVGEQNQNHVIERERAILEHLDGRVNPRILSAGQYGGRHYLVTAWLDGKHAAAAAAGLRNSIAADARPKLVALCCAIASAYAHLHAQGVLHGDVHPRNILVDDRGTVRLIDFGLSRLCNDAGPWLTANRGGVGFFFEPEYARACLEGSVPPQTSIEGELYAVCALLYSLLTGADYLEFSFEHAQMLRQIVEEPPLPFYKRGAVPMPQLEHVLARGLSKEPAARFGSMDELCKALCQAGAEEAAREATTTTPTSVGQALLTDVLRRLDHSEAFFAEGVTNAPTCSVTYGAAGIAYALYRLSVVRRQPRLLALADLWCQRALRTRSEPHAFYHPRFDVRPETVGHTTPYHTASGTYSVQALIAHVMGDRGSQRAATAAFIAASELPCDNLDLTLGRSGTLLACSLLLDIAESDEMGAFGAVSALGERTVQGVWERINALAPIQEQQEIEYLGIAHGWAGILYATLRWHRAAASPLPRNVSERLRQLAECAETWANGARWSAILNKQMYMPGWCNGSAGFVYLWTLAHRVYGEPVYLELAEQAGWDAWQGRDTLPTLCCGLAGRGYALLKLYKHTSDAAWLTRAKELAERAAGTARGNKDLANSLYKGEVGVATLVADLVDPGAACMPFFEEEGWRMTA